MIQINIVHTFCMNRFTNIVETTKDYSLRREYRKFVIRKMSVHFASNTNWRDLAMRVSKLDEVIYEFYHIHVHFTQYVRDNEKDRNHNLKSISKYRNNAFVIEANFVLTKQNSYYQDRQDSDQSWFAFYECSSNEFKKCFSMKDLNVVYRICSRDIYMHLIRF